MTRILAFGDTQIGVATVDLSDQRDVLDRIVQVALERKVDAVLHGGDVFEGPVVTPEQLRCFVDGVRPLHQAGIPLLVIRGNGRHDMAVRDVHALDILREVDGIQVSDSPAVCPFIHYKHHHGEKNEGFIACTLPWVHPGKLIATMNGGLTHEEADLNTSEMLVRIAAHLFEKAKNYYPPGQNDDHQVVLLAHWAISGSALRTGIPVDEMREPILPWAELDAIGYDAVIGAHIHQPQQISQPLIDRTLGIVCGSPQQLNHGEKGEHGCWIVEMPAEADPEASFFGSAGPEFVPIQSKRFVTIDWPVQQLTNPVYELTVAGARNFVQDEDIVRVRYEATEDDARRVNHDHIRALLTKAGASRVQIEPTIIRKERARAQEISEQLSPIDALAAYCEANDVEPDRALAMLARLKEWSE